MKKYALVALAAFTLTGCATNKDYQLYAETQKAIAQANAMSETARYAALAEIAKTADPGARVAAVMSINFGAQGGNGPRAQQVNPPKSFGDTALQWTSVLLPSLTQFYSISANRQVAVTQSNNAAAVAQSTNNTFATMNAAGHNANTTIAGQGFTAVTTVANTGIGQVGTTAAAGLNAVTAVNASSNTAITNVSNAANTSIQTIASTLPLIQPNVTTTTNTTTTTTNNTTP